MSTSYYQANRILDRNFGNTAFSPPATLYIGLSTTSINADGTGSTEPVAASYARVAVTNNKTNFSTAASGSLSNAVEITFAESSGSWGTITYVFVADALTSGNILYYQPLTSSRAVPTLTTVYFAVGGFVVTMT